MRCIFCKNNSDNCKSIEHIVPESLGNKEHVLPKGVVCDSCNSYFSLKIEKPALESDFFKNLRFRTGIESKKGKIPPGKGIIPLTNDFPEIYLPKHSNNIEVVINKESYELIRQGKIKQMYVPMSTSFPENNQHVSRMLAKIGYEFLVLRLSETDIEIREFVIDEDGLQPIRKYVRYNPKNENWVYSVRKIYEEDETFYLEDGKSVDMVFECDFLYTNKMELYFVIAFKGVEFVINMTGSSIDGYNTWLADKNNISPLYDKGQGFGYTLTPNFLK